MRRIITIIVFITLLFVSHFSLFRPIYSQTKDEQQEQVPPLEFQVNHIANIFEKFKEKTTLFFKFSQNDKYNYQKFLLEKRLAELKWVVDSHEWQPVEETSSRYATYLSKFNDFVIKDNLKSNKKDEILQNYERHKKILEALQRNFKYDSGWWLLLQHDINLIKQFSNL